MKIDFGKGDHPHFAPLVQSSKLVLANSKDSNPDSKRAKLI
jgi:hypothetical protein